ncbi:MAG: hypothetical protein F9K25_19470 [Candidatus Contendobacter sp.]|nr:MAG: hypothetical protein F9K25_19470 [Candidatus Contendobacter sp.]
MKAVMMTILLLSVLSAPAFSQTYKFYKCPSSTPGAPPVIQQMPCSPQGGGEKIKINPILSTGSDLQVNEQGKAYMQGNEERWKAQAEADRMERERQEALEIERDKVRAQREATEAFRRTAKQPGEGAVPTDLYNTFHPSRAWRYRPIK